ncbi:MAG: neutral/alkaline non-lysosomal ceramidase N-terminal domain-containing protein [Bryobacterales bacterium]|nr:neutral/alkaline non-lysosomal ceramidase N-terminal domain-containing protein [Bryobacterales bacterium]
MNRLAWLALLLVLPAAGQPFEAGVARAKITPSVPVWLAGFAARTAPAQSVWTDLWAKALALRDTSGNRMVIVTMDLVGISRQITDEVASRLERTHGLRRGQILFNASHTHSGPGVWPSLAIYTYDSPADREKVRLYGVFLMDQLEAVASHALDSMQPATLASCWGEAPFAVNRRTEQLKQIRPGEKFASPVDHRVPVLRVLGAGGSPLAILFGYACHNVTMTGNTNEVNGDYAGAAQAEIERRYPGATAMFLNLCAGDQRSMPRGTREWTLRHGRELADAVQTALGGTPTPLAGQLRSAYLRGTLPFLVHQREIYAADAKSSDYYAARRGRAMLEAYDAGKPVTTIPYPVEAFAIGRSFVLLALGGEAVVDYSLRFTREYPGVNLVVAGYSNDVMSYIPSLRVWREGGYESGDAMMYFALPGWYTDQVEERVADLAHRAMETVGFTVSAR